MTHASMMGLSEFVLGSVLVGTFICITSGAVVRVARTRRVAFGPWRLAAALLSLLLFTSYGDHGLAALQTEDLSLPELLRYGALPAVVAGFMVGRVAFAAATRRRPPLPTAQSGAIR